MLHNLRLEIADALKILHDEVKIAPNGIVVCHQPQFKQKKEFINEQDVVLIKFFANRVPQLHWLH